MSGRACSSPASDEVEVAVIERNPVFDGSLGQDEIAEFIEEIRDCKPESGVAWLHEFLASVKTVYAFQHLQGDDTEEGSNALHALRSNIWERGDAIIQADGEGFTNEEGYHIVWQFSDSVSGPWNMGVSKTKPGTISKWISATPIIAPRSWPVKSRTIYPQLGPLGRETSRSRS